MNIDLSFNLLLADKSLSPDLRAVAEKVMASQRISFDDAVLLYEEADSKQQLSLLIQIVNTLRFTKYLSDENYENLTTKTCQYSSKLLRKPDQCRAAFSCSHLFWPHENVIFLYNRFIN